MEHNYKICLSALSSDDGGGYLAFAPALKGCSSTGATKEQAMKNVEEAIELWIETAEEMGWEVPEPER